MKVILHDGAEIFVEVKGVSSNRSILLPVNPNKLPEKEAEEKRKWGVDPDLGRKIIDSLADRYRVIAFDYEGHVMEYPKSNLTPENITNDFLAIADAVNAETFAYYGYSWLALCGMQLAIRSNRLQALIMGGFPPLNGIYKEMLIVTEQAYKMSLEQKTKKKDINTKYQDFTNYEDYDWSDSTLETSPNQTGQFLKLYESLKTFNDKDAQNDICCSKLCFVGDKDSISYPENWGGILVDIGNKVINSKLELESFGWFVQILKDCDHTKAMQPDKVIPILLSFLLDNY